MSSLAVLVAFGAVTLMVLGALMVVALCTFIIYKVDGDEPTFRDYIRSEIVYALSK